MRIASVLSSLVCLYHGSKLSQATEDFGTIAGIRVEQVINESAAIAWGTFFGVNDP